MTSPDPVSAQLGDGCSRSRYFISLGRAGSTCVWRGRRAVLSAEQRAWKRRRGAGRAVGMRDAVVRVVKDDQRSRFTAARHGRAAVRPASNSTERRAGDEQEGSSPRGSSRTIRRFEKKRTTKRRWGLCSATPEQLLLQREQKQNLALVWAGVRAHTRGEVENNDYCLCRVYCP